MKFDPIRETETAQLKAQIIRDLIWKSRSTGHDPDLAYMESLAAQVDEILFKVIINLNKKEKENAKR
jgi:hypothetical protein